LNRNVRQSASVFFNGWRNNDQPFETVLQAA
jgi:hypothetical protein